MIESADRESAKLNLCNEPLAAVLSYKILIFIQFFIRLRTRSVDLAPTSPIVLSTYSGFADSSPGISVRGPRI